jgi:hypothetical protein
MADRWDKTQNYTNQIHDIMTVVPIEADTDMHIKIPMAEKIAHMLLKGGHLFRNGILGNRTGNLYMYVYASYTLTHYPPKHMEYSYIIFWPHYIFSNRMYTRE